MTSNWTTVKLSQVAKIVGGGTPSTSESNYWDGNIPWITPKDLSSHKDMYISSGSRSITDEGLKNSSAKLVPKDTVLFTSRAPIGYVAIAAQSVCTNQGFKSLVLNEGYDSRYFYYLLKHHTPEIEARATGSTFKEISGAALGSFEISMPPAYLQKSISDILGTLDDRISLLRETNQTLEAIAQALFKSWFVDFDPVRAKAEGKLPEGIDAATAALFPDAFDETEMGVVPKGWQISTLASVSDVGIGKTPPRKEAHWFSETPQDVRWVSIRDMGNSGAYISSTTEYLTAEAVDKFNVRRIPDKTVLLSFKMTIGRVSITDGEMTTNEAIAHCKLTQNSPVCSEYIYLHLKQFDYASLSSTSSIADAVNSKAVKAIPILVPSIEVHSAFKKVTDVLFEKIKINHQQIQALITLRDTLLPRLISGQLRIADAEAELEKAVA